MNSESITSKLKSVSDVLHRIRVKLYTNHLKVGKRYIARTANEKSLNIDEVCASLKNRGGFSGDYENLLDHVRRYQDEAAFLLCNGFAINSGFYTVYLNVGGTLNSPREDIRKGEHPVTARIRSSIALKELLKDVEISVDSVADSNGYIHQLYDVYTDTFNDALTGGHNFIITGDKIKVVGDHEDCGVYFESVDDPDKRIKVQERFTENFPSKVIGTVPILKAPQTYRVVIVTQYTNSSKALLKEPREITSSFELDVT